MTKFKANIFETVLAILTLLGIVGLLFYFYDLTQPGTNNPFTTYNNNPGIIKISTATLIAKTLFISCFLFLARDKLKQNRKILTIYLLAALAIGFLQWFELYYSSTFYYGEVRDKQGLQFPIIASFMTILVIWKINYSESENRNLAIKLILTGLINVALYFLWTLVSEPWNLWQS